jgi:DNA modification methylase
MKQKPQIRDRIKELRRVCATDLVPAPVNWRTHSAKQKTALASVLEEIGIADAVLARELPDGRLQIIDGHLRRETLGESLLPVLVLDVSEREAAILLATIDPLAAMAGTDAEKLDAILREAVATTEGVQELLAEIADDAGLYRDDENKITEDEVPDPPPEPITRPGDLWLMGDHRLLCGDSTKAKDVVQLIDLSSVSMLLTDPPYGVSYSGISKTMYYGKDKHGSPREKIEGDATPEEAAKVISSSLSTISCPLAFVWCAPQFRRTIEDVMTGLGWDIFTIICWNKNHANFGAINARYKPKFEMALVCKKTKIPWYGPDNEVTVWDADRSSANKFHPTQKPVELFTRAISNHTQQGELIVDPFLGSGTTLIAAEQLGRRCYGLEISPAYCDVIVSRWEKLTGRKATLERSPHPPEHAK